MMEAAVNNWKMQNGEHECRLACEGANEEQTFFRNEIWGGKGAQEFKIDDWVIADITPLKNKDDLVLCLLPTCSYLPYTILLTPVQSPDASTGSDIAFHSGRSVLYFIQVEVKMTAPGSGMYITRSLTDLQDYRRLEDGQHPE